MIGTRKQGIFPLRLRLLLKLFEGLRLNLSLDPANSDVTLACFYSFLLVSDVRWTGETFLQAIAGGCGCVFGALEILIRLRRDILDGSSVMKKA